jgi:hypothetical protein
MTKRERQQSEIGDEIKCSKCGEFWPADSEFFFMSKGKPHSWCKACYCNDPKIVAKNQRFIEKSSKHQQMEVAA